MFQAKNLWIIHLLGWMLFISLPLTIVSRELRSDLQLALLTSGSFWLFFAIYFFLFYFNLLVLLPRLFLKQRYVLYSVIFVGAFLLVYFSQPFENLIFRKFHRLEQAFQRDEIFPGPPPDGFRDRPPRPLRAMGEPAD